MKVDVENVSWARGIYASLQFGCLFVAVDHLKIAVREADGESLEK